MQRLIKNILATTGLTLITLAIIATLHHAEFLFVRSVYQSFLANIFIHVGLLFIKKYENKYFYIEIFLEISYVLCLLIIAGFLFQWYSSTPIWIIVLMGIGIYIISSLVNIININDDIASINIQLKSKNNNSNDNINSN